MEALITRSNGKYQVELSDNREVNKTKGILIADGIDTARIGSEFVIHTYCGKRFTGSVLSARSTERLKVAPSLRRRDQR